MRVNKKKKKKKRKREKRRSKDKKKRKEKEKEKRRKEKSSTIVRRFHDKAGAFERWENVARASGIDVCAAERRSIRQRWRRRRPRPRRLQLWLQLRPRPRPRRRERRQHRRRRRRRRRRGWRREVSFVRLHGRARLSICEPTLPFLLLSSTAPHPSATAAAAAAPPAPAPAASRPNPRSADTSAPTFLSLSPSLVSSTCLLSVSPSFPFHLSLPCTRTFAVLRSPFSVSSTAFPFALFASFPPPLSFFSLLSLLLFPTFWFFLSAWSVPCAPIARPF